MAQLWVASCTKLDGALVNTLQQKAEEGAQTEKGQLEKSRIEPAK
jgi:hypothetical protein